MSERRFMQQKHICTSVWITLVLCCVLLFTSFYPNEISIQKIILIRFHLATTAVTSSIQSDKCWSKKYPNISKNGQKGGHTVFN